MNFMEILKKIVDKDISSFNEFKFKLGAELSPLMIVLITAAFFLFLYLAGRSTKGLKSKRRRVMLIAFRSIALAFILMIAFQPKIELRETKELKNSMAVLFDNSLSMSLEKDAKKLSRFETVKKYIEDNDSYFNKLEEDFNVDYYAFGKELKSTSLSEFVEGVNADQSNTKIGEAIESLKKENPKAEYTDVMLFSDGNDNGKISGFASNLNTALDKELFKKYVKSLDIKIHPVITEGEEEDFPDIGIKRVVADKFGFIRTPFEIEVHIRINGMKGMSSVPVALKEGDNIISTETLVLESGKKDYTVNMKFYPQQIGKKVYTALIPNYSKELIETNNRKSFYANIIRDKTRVLFVVGSPTWDERFLRRALKSNPNIDLISFMILRTRYDYLNVPEKEMSLIPFPTREIFERELHTFDVVIFCNFDYGPYVSRRYLNNIKNYVEKDGGAFVMIGGDKSFLAGGYFNTPINDILPVEISSGSTLFSYGKFNPVLTDTGNTHPVLRIDYDEDMNRQLYEALPALEGINTVLRPKRDAVSLMNHPKARNEHGAAPVVVISEAGKGRSMAVMTDTLWKWNLPYIGIGGSPRIYENFWHNALKWLVKDPELDLVKLTLKDTNFSAGDAMKIRLRVLNHKYQPTDSAKITAEVKTESGKAIKLDFKKTDSLGEYTASFTPKEEGIYSIEASARIGKKSLGKDIHPFIVEDAQAEYQELELNRKLLDDIALMSGAKSVTLKNGGFSENVELDTTKEEQLLGKMEITFWDSKVNFVIIFMFLMMEWYIRRKYGLY